MFCHLAAIIYFNHGFSRIFWVLGVLGVLRGLGELGGDGFAAWDTGCDYVL